MLTVEAGVSVDRVTVGPGLHEVPLYLPICIDCQEPVDDRIKGFIKAVTMPRVLERSQKLLADAAGIAKLHNDSHKGHNAFVVEHLVPDTNTH